MIGDLLTLEGPCERDEETEWLHPFEDNRLSIQLQIVEEFVSLESKEAWFERMHLTLCRRVAGGN